MSAPPNPYAPPTAGATTVAKGARRAPAGALTVAFAVVAAMTAMASGELLVAQYVVLPQDLTLHVADSVTVLSWTRIGIALAWIHGSWKDLPPTRNPEHPTTTPGQAVGYFFIPFYNLYWMFKGNALLCDSLDLALAEAGRDRPRAPRDLALLAGIVQLAVPVFAMARAPAGLHVAVMASTGAWLVFMLRCDRTQRALGSGRRRRKRKKKSAEDDGRGDGPPLVLP